MADIVRTRPASPLAPIARGLFLAAMVGVTGIVPTPAHTQDAAGAAAPAARDYDIPAGPLDQTLNAFAERAGLVLAVDGALTAGKTSPGVQGSYTPEEALRRLLAGTGLGYRFTGADTVTLARAAIEGEQGPLQLETVTVLGTRQIDVPLSNVPGSITVLDREAIQEEAAISRRTEDILSRTIPGFVPGDALKQIRGRTAQVFINGVPVNEQLRASAGSDINRLRADQLAGVEVARGANSAYGFGSPGGIIALQTPRAQSEELTLRTTVRESVNPQQIGGSHQASLYQSASQIVGDFDYHLAGAVAYDGLAFDPDGDPANTSATTAFLGNNEEVIYNFDTSVGLDLRDSGRLRLTGTFGYVDVKTLLGTNLGVFGQTFGSLFEEPGGEAFRRTHTVNLSYENADVLGSTLKVEAFNSNSRDVKETINSGFSPLVRDEQTNEFYGARSSVNTPIELLLEGSSITYGFDYLRNRFFRPRFDLAAGTIFDFISPDVTLESYAPHGQLEIPVENFLLTGGVRHEIYDGDVETAVGPGGIQGGDIDGFSLTLYNVGVVYFLNDYIDLYGSFSQGAEITQLGRAARSASTAEQIELQPAKSDQFEVGVRWDWANVSGNLAAYFTESDLIADVFCDGINPCVPLREPREFWGIEAKADWRISRQWALSGVLAWQDGIRELADGDVRRASSDDVPPLLLTANIDYRPFPWWRNTLQFDYFGSRDPFGGSTAFNEGPVDEELLVNLSVGFDVGPGKLQLGVENLFNNEYVAVINQASNSGFSFIPEEGTRVSLSYSMEW